MRTKLQAASGIAVVATLMTALFSANGSSALAQASASAPPPASIQTQFISQPVIQTLPSEQASSASAASNNGVNTAPENLAAQVAAQPRDAGLDPQIRCLAGAIYFEARGESLAGQLAVGRVVVARAGSGRFPDSYCGVVFQPSQFSFVRGRNLPSVREDTAAWQRAVAVAHMAHSGDVPSQTEGALFFHAARVSPKWRLTRLARVDNHVFYR